MAIEQQITHERLSSVLEQTVLAIAKAVAVRDEYTADHQRRVTELCVAIAEEIGMPDFQIEGLRLTAAIHDLGNLKIPADILNKPGKLSALEFELIKSHAKIGHDILSGIEFPWPIADIILQHHEHMDGSGYPEGLKGEEILLESRILLVANAIEAMTAYRPCQDPIPVDAAISEIKKYRGTRYDTSIVDACIKVLHTKKVDL